MGASPTVVVRPEVQAVTRDGRAGEVPGVARRMCPRLLRARVGPGPPAVKLLSAVLLLTAARRREGNGGAKRGRGRE